jgi:hypothetical protein
MISGADSERDLVRLPAAQPLFSARRHLPIYTGRPNMTDTSYYGIRLAYQNSTTGTNFFDGCIGANVSSVRSDREAR